MMGYKLAVEWTVKGQECWKTKAHTQQKVTQVIHPGVTGMKVNFNGLLRGVNIYSAYIIYAETVVL